MPRGRPKQTKNKEATMTEEDKAVGPEKSVAAKPKKKKKEYVRILAKNLLEPGDPISFTAQGKAYTILEDVEAVVPVDVAENLEKIKIKRTVMTPDPDNPMGIRRKQVKEMQRFIITRLGPPEEK